MSYIHEALLILREELTRVGKGNQETAFEHGYLLLLMSKGVETDEQDVHDVWAIVRMVNRPEHADLIPFDQLSEETIAYDTPFVNAIHAAAKRLAK